MRDRLPEEWRDRYDDDQLLNVVDIIWDFYEDHGMLDIDAAFSEDSDDPTADDIIRHTEKLLRKDKGATIDPAHVGPIVEAELAYEESIGLGE